MQIPYVRNTFPGLTMLSLKSPELMYIIAVPVRYTVLFIKFCTEIFSSTPCIMFMLSIGMVIGDTP